MVSFDWNDLLEPHIPSSTPFQITVLVESMLKCTSRCVVSILSSSPWKALGSPKLVSSITELLAFEKKPSECSGILSQFPITLGRKNILVDILVVLGPLDFNMLLGCDYVYAMKAVVYSLFCVMHFHHKGIIVTIAQLSSDNHHPSLISSEFYP
jgi:hypothetical protein